MTNELKMIPNQFNLFSNLDTLILNNNKIKFLSNLDQCKNLTRLELRSNRIEIIENIDKLVSLKFITLSCNLIKSIAKISDTPMLKLEELGLFGNYLGNK